MTNIQFERPPCSEIGSQLVQIVYEDHLPPQSLLQRILKIGIKALGTIPCFLSTAPHFYVALLLDGVTKILTTLSIVINFGALTLWGFYCLVDKLLDTPLITQKEDIKLLGITAKIARFAFALFLGMSTRLTSLGIFFKLRDQPNSNLSVFEMVIGALLAILFRSTTTSFSMYESLTYGEKSIKDGLCTSSNEKLLRTIQANLSACIGEAADQTIELSPEERKEKFSTFFEFKQEGELAKDKKEILNELFNQTLTFAKENEHRRNSGSHLLYMPRKVVEVLSMVAPTALVIQNGLLTYDAVKNFLISTIASVAYAIFSALTFCWVGYKYCMLAAGDLFQKVFGLGCANQQKTFGETFYPKTVFAMDIMRIIMAAFTYAEVAKVAEFYADPKTWWGFVFIWANVLASFLLIINAMQDFYEASLRNLSETSLADPKAQEAAFLLRKLENLKQMVELCYASQVRQLLKDMDEDNLKKILGKDISFNAVKEVLEQA